MLVKNWFEPTEFKDHAGTDSKRKRVLETNVWEHLRKRKHSEKTHLHWEEWDQFEIQPVKASSSWPQTKQRWHVDITLAEL